ncbi:MAG: hypothetical protein M3N32_04730 [Actinomycetota bacterium]|nr:hypothetical protein [Actinomycetota bacterium]
MRARRSIAAIGAVVLLGGWSGAGAADDDTPEHFCAPDGKGGWERHDNVSPEEAGDLAAKGGFEIDEENPCPPEEQTQGLGNLCEERPQHPACNPDQKAVSPTVRRGSKVHDTERHKPTKAVETPFGGVDTGGWPDGIEDEQAGGAGTSLVVLTALGAPAVTAGLLRRPWR